MRLWGGRFSEANDARVEAFTSSIEIDRELAADDLAGSIAHVRGLGRAGPADRRPGRRARRRPHGARRGRRRRPARLGSGARGRPPQPRGGAGRADRAGGRPPPHRPLAQRPGRHGPAALDAPRHRPARRRARRVRARARRAWPSATARPSCPGTTHIQPAQPVLFAHHLLAYVEMAERDRGRLATRAGASTSRPLGRGRAGRRRLPARSRGDGGGARLRRRHRELARRGQRPRLRRRGAGRGRARDGPPQPPRRGDRPGGRTRASGSCARPTPSRPAARSCRTRRTRTRPSWSAAARPASSGS